MSRFRRGFTLIEMLAAIVVIGVLAGLALFGYGQVMERTYQAAMLNDLRNFATVRSLHVSQLGSFPETVEEVPGHDYSPNVFEMDYWNGGEFWSLVVGHRRTETICSVTMYEGESYWIGCEKRAQLEFDARQGATPLAIDFDATNGVADIGLSVSEIKRVAWSYGDGATFAGGEEEGESSLTPSHTYGQGGRYRVQLVVVPKEGRMRVGSRSVTVGSGEADGAPPVALFDAYEVLGEDGEEEASPSVSGGGTSFFASLFGSDEEAWNTEAPMTEVLGDTLYLPVGAELQLDATPSFDPEGRKITDYRWSFSGVTTKLDGKVVKHLMTTEPSITLTITNDLGLTSSRTRYVKFVNPGAPLADFTWNPEPADVGQPVEFNAAKSSHSGLRSIVSYQWSFAGEDSASGITAKHTFDTDGAQEVTLTVTDERGVSDSKTSTVNVRSRGLQVNWDFCDSFGRSEIEDLMGGSPLSLTQLRTFELPWNKYWKEGPPAHLRLRDYEADQKVVGGMSSIAEEATTWTWVILQNQTGGTGTQYLLNLHSSPQNRNWTLFRSNGNISLSDQSSSYSFGAWPTDWSTIMVKSTFDGNYSQDVEVFVNGVSRGVQRMRHASPIGTLRLFGNLTLNSSGEVTNITTPFVGDVGGVKLFTGPMDAAAIQAEHEALMQKVAGGCIGATEESIEANFSVSPAVPEVGMEATFDASASTSTSSAIVRYEWDFGDWEPVVTTKPVVRHTFSGAGRFPVELKVFDAAGHEASIIQDVTVHDAAVLRADWNACHSFGESEIRNLTGGTPLKLGQDALTPVPWGEYWKSGPPAHLQADSVDLRKRRIWAEANLDGTNRSWTMFFLQRHSGTGGGTQYLYQTANTAARGTLFTIFRSSTGDITNSDQSQSYNYGPWPTGWSVIAVQVRENPIGAGGYRQVAEVFVDGVSRGVDTGINESTPSGATHLLRPNKNQPLWVSTNFAGQLSSVKWYDGYIPSERVAEISEAMLQDSSIGCERVNNITTQARFTYEPEEPSANDTVRFDASASSISQGEIVSYEWDFGTWDPVITTGPTTEHVFAEAGDYSVQLIVHGSAGTADTVTQAIVVHPEAELIARWSPCASHGQSSIVDTEGGNPIKLQQILRTSIQSYPQMEKLYSRETPASIVSGYQGPRLIQMSETPVLHDLSSRVRGNLIAPARSQKSWTLMWLQRAAPDNAATKYVMQTRNSSGVWVSLNGGTDISVYTNPNSYRFGPWPTGWATIAYRFQELPDGNQTAEVFVNGVSRGVQQPHREVVLGDSTMFWGYETASHFRWEYNYSGDIGEMRLVEGSLAEHEIVRMHDEMMNANCEFPETTPLEALFTHTPETPEAGVSVLFDATSSTSPNGYMTYWWEFPDGGRNGALITHRFKEAGTYPVTLIVASAGEVDSITKHITVVPAGENSLSARFNITPVEGGVNETIHFNASESTGAINRYDWVFYGAGTSNANVTRSGIGFKTTTEDWASEGYFLVTLTVRNAKGESASESQYVSIRRRHPTAVIKYTPANPVIGDTVYFTGIDSDPRSDGTITEYTWSAEEAFQKGASPTFKHVFTRTGPSHVTLGVLSSTGGWGSTSTTVMVGANHKMNIEPEAWATVTPSRVARGGTIQLDGSYSRDLDSEPDSNTKLRYEWEIYPVTERGDRAGASVFSRRIKSSFSTEVDGMYDIYLTVTDPSGAKDSDGPHTVIVGNPFDQISLSLFPRDQYVVWDPCTQGSSYSVKLQGEARSTTGMPYPNTQVTWGVISGPARMSSASQGWVPIGTGATVQLDGSGIVEVYARTQEGVMGRATIRATRKPESGCAPTAPPAPGGHSTGEESGTSTPSVASIEFRSLGTSTLALNAGQKLTYRFKAVPLDASGKVLTSTNVSWSLEHGTYKGTLPSPLHTLYLSPHEVDLVFNGPTNANGTIYVVAKSGGKVVKHPVQVYCGFSGVTCQN